MPRPIKLDIDPMAVDANGLVTDVTLSAGGVQNFVFDGALTDLSTFQESYSLPATNVFGAKALWGRRLLVTSVGNDAGITFTVTGTDADGRAMSEAITGPNATTGESVGYFHTVTAIASSGDTADDVSWGTVDEIRTKSVMLNHHGQVGATSHAIETGTSSFTIEQCAQDLTEEYKTAATEQADLSFIEAEAAGSANVITELSVGAHAVTLTFVSYSSGAENLWTLTQSAR